MHICRTYFLISIDHIFDTLTFDAHNFLDIDPFLTNLAPLERSREGLFNGTRIVKNGNFLTKLWGFYYSIISVEKLIFKNPNL